MASEQDIIDIIGEPTASPVPKTPVSSAGAYDPFDEKLKILDEPKGYNPNAAVPGPASPGVPRLRVTNPGQPLPPPTSDSDFFKDTMVGRGMSNVNDFVNWAGTHLTKGGIGLATLPNTVGQLTKREYDKSPALQDLSDANDPEAFGQAGRGFGEVMSRFWPTYKQGHDLVFDTLGVPERQDTNRLEKIAGAGVEAIPAMLGGGPAAAGLGFLGGSSGEVAAEMFPNHPELARFAAGVIIPATTVGAVRGATRLVEPVSTVVRPFTEAGQQQIAGKALSEAAAQTPEELLASVTRSTDPKVQAQPLSPKDTEIVPGSSPTLGQWTGNPSILAQERAVAGKSPSANREFNIRAADQNAARKKALENIEPSANNASDTASFISGRAAQMQAIKEKAFDEARERARQKIEALGPSSGDLDRDRQLAGQIIQGEFQAAYNEIKGQVKSQFEKVDAAGNVELNYEPITAKASAAAAKYFGPKSTPPKEETLALLRDLNFVSSGSSSAAPTWLSTNQALLQRLKTNLERLAKEGGAHDVEPPKTLPYSELDAIDKRAGNIMRSSDPKSGDYAVAVAVRQGIRARMEQAAADSIDAAIAGRTSEMSPEQAFAYLDAKRLRAEQGQRFEQGASKELSTRRQYGEPNLTPSEAPAAYFNTSRGSMEDSAKFIEALGGRPRAVQAAKDYLTSELRRFALRPDGTIDPRKFGQFMQRYGGAMHPFPELERDFRSAAIAQEGLEASAEIASKTAGDFEKSAARFFLKSDPDVAIGEALRSPNASKNIGDLVKLAKEDATGDALRGLRRGILDNAMQKGLVTGTDAAGERTLSYSGFQKWLDANRKNIEPAFEPGHLDMIDRIGKDLQRSAATYRGPYGGGSTTPQSLSMAQVLDSILNRGIVAPALMRLPVVRNVVDSTVGQAGKVVYGRMDEKIQAMFERALLDPEYARTLLMKATVSPNSTVMGRLKRQFDQLTDYGNAGKSGLSAVGSSNRGAPEASGGSEGSNDGGGGNVGDQIADLQRRLDEAKDFALSAPSTASNAMMQTLDHMNRLRDQIRSLGGKPRGELNSNIKVAGDAQVTARRELQAQINKYKFDLRNTPGMNGDDAANLSIKIRELQEQLQSFGGLKRY